MRNTTVTGICTTVALLMAFAVTANAQSKGKAAAGKVTPAAGSASSSEPPTSAAGAKLKDDKVDVSDLENKYWAPKDTDFSVVQNRTYTKEKRFFGTLHYGPLVNDKYNEGNMLGVSANYFMSERFGFQATYLKADLKNSEVVTALQTQFATGVLPNFGRMTNYYGAGFSWVPFYAKMSFMGKKIIYFDMAVTPTLGMTAYDQQVRTGNRSQSAFTYGVDITQYFFLSNYFAVRVDMKNQWYKEKRVIFHNANPALVGADVNSPLNHTTMFLLGATFFY